MAYAAVVSLLNILDELQHPDPLQSIPYPRAQVQLLHEKLSYLQQFLEMTFSGGDLEVNIREAMYEAEDVFDSNLSNFVLSSESAGWAEENYMSSFCDALEGVISAVNSIVEMAEKISPNVSDRPLSSIPEVSRRNNLIVGREADLNHLTDRLMAGSDALQTVPILGISGIGKTHLARIVYEDPDIVSKFRLRAWVKISQEYSKKEVLLSLLHSLRKLGSGKGQERTEDELAKLLFRILRSGNYLIVLDDVCNPEAWDNLEELFPDYNNGSRVMLTTRRKEVAESAAGSQGGFEEILPFNEEESWSLLQSVVFRYKPCPEELEETARRVSGNCKGLPLAIVTVGGVLMEAGPKDWEIAASSLGDCGNCDELIDAVMLLSYKSLRQHVKPCLLYMGIFPNNYEIPVAKLLKLWIAEGFIEKMSQLQSLEEVAGECLSQLVDRGIVLVSEQSPIGKTKTCRIDGVYHEFLKKKAEEEKFFHVVNGYTSCFPDETWTQGRFCILNNIHFANRDELKAKESVPTVRSLLFGGAQEQFPLWVHLDFKLLRVLDALKVRFYSFPDEVLKLVHLRYLALTYNGEIPESICGLWNLRFLIVLRHLSSKISEAVSLLPLEIWNLNELRHLQLMGSDLPDSSTPTPRLENLVTLLDVSSHSCTPGILQRVPNLRKLGVRIESPALDAAEDFSFLTHLITLQHLESFKCVVMHPDFASQVVSSIPCFPTTLTKLSLSGCGLSWDIMKVIAILPNLVSMKLRWYAFRGSEWKQEGDGREHKDFPRLKFLLLEDLDIVWWKASSGNFPLLTNLVIRHCYKLQEIPSGIGNIPTLKKIELVDCSSAAVKSAQKIKDDQRSKGFIQVDFHSSRDD
ncbi:putative late blight resistance protein homolog R1A-10 [Salvia miltiorrhiza]|uniref:putative late blight resistance protein homolog R1A-10 n=1 Tax=Salvia miltiorrhiza TaxID=226208 RepID=UPI0025AC92D8|nr:putative late blight resistance protein homolog R1A-10 [Salvia miltiorrhiza]